MTEFIDRVNFQQQPTYNTCVSTCLAMILNVDCNEVIDEFHGKYWDYYESDRVIVSSFLSKKGVEFDYCSFEQQPDTEGIYLVTVPSLNIKGGNHNILWVVESSGEEGLFFQRILDPAAGRDDKYYYTNIDDLLNSEFLATKINGYRLDLHIKKSQVMKLLDSTTNETGK